MSERLPECPYCQSPIEEGERIAVCLSCRTQHHEQCWDENGRCAAAECGGVMASRRIAASGNASEAREEADLDREQLITTQTAAQSGQAQCIKCGHPVKPGKVLCLPCRMDTVSHRFENCAGPSVILLGGFIGIIALIVKALT